MTLLNKLRKPDFWKASTLVVLVLYGLFFIYPIVNLLAQSIYDPSLGGFTLTHFNKFFSQPYYLKTIVNSFQVTIIATLLTLLIGIPLAYFTTVYKVRGKKFLNIIIILCSMSAPFIGAYSWLLLLGRSGLITKFLPNTFGIVIPDI